MWLREAQKEMLAKEQRWSKWEGRKVKDKTMQERKKQQANRCQRSANTADI
jgi:hypothetical protein